jgi:hypothetical protein
VISTEQLLTSPSAFAICGDKTATASQRAACRIIDGVPLRELACDPDVIRFVGGPEAVERLPSQHGHQPTEVVLLAAIRTAKSILASAAAIRATQAVDVSKLGPGEIPRVSVVSLKLDVSLVVFRLITETIQASELLRGLLIDEPTTDSVMLLHPSGRPVEVSFVAGARAGAGLVARWSAGVIFDEAPRMTGAEDGVVNLDHARSAVLGRLLPGAQVLYIGSPWAPRGPVYDMTQEHWQKPSEHVVVLRGTGPMLNPSHWTPARCEKLRAQDPVAYQTDVLGEFADPESGLLSPIAVRRNTREAPLELAPERGAHYVGAVDLSDVTTGNAATLVILQIIPTRNAEDDSAACRFRVAIARQWRGVGIEACLREMADICRVYGVRTVGADRFAGEANAAVARRFGLTLDIASTTAAGNVEAYTDLATIIHTDRLELSPDRVLRDDLLSVRKRVVQNGYSIVLPKTADGRHADFAPALCTAVKRGGHPSTYDPDYYRVVSVRSERADPALRREKSRWISPDVSVEERARRFFNDESGGRR